MLVQPHFLLSMVLGCLGVLGLATTARAATVSWTAPAVCPDHALVVERIEAARGGPLAGDAAVDFAAEVSEQADGRLRLTVRVGDEGAGRTLLAGDCEELATALGQIVSLALGPHVPREGAEPPAEPASEVPAQPDAPASDRTPPQKFSLFDDAADPVRDTKRSAPRAREKARLVGLLGMFDGGALGTASLGVQLEAGVGPASWFELRAVGGYVPSHSKSSEDSAQAGGLFSLLFAGMLGCAVWYASPWSTPLCGGMEVGSLRASGSGVSEPDSKDVWWLAARADARLGVELTSSLRANLLAGLVLPLLRHEFSVDGARIFRIPALSPRAGLGLEYAF